MTSPLPNPGAPGFREFVPDPQAPSADHEWHDDCGEYALEFAKARAKHDHATIADLLALDHQMLHNGTHKGGTTLYGLAREAELQGLSIHTEWDYSDAFNHDWHKHLLDTAGIMPTVLFFTNAGALHDAETGIGYSWRTPWKYTGPALSGHFICVLDKKATGYICADGANPQSPSRYSVYSFDTLNKAGVHGLLTLNVNGTMPVTTTAPAGLGPGFAAQYVHEGQTATVEVPETRFSLHPEMCFAILSNGTVYFWSDTVGKVQTDKAAYVAQLNFNEWVAARNKPAPVAPPAMPADARANVDAAYKALSAILTKY